MKNFDLEKVKQVAKQYHADVITSVEVIKGFSIINKAAYEQAAEFIKLVKATYKDIESQRTALTKPLLDLKREVDEYFREPRERLLEMEINLKNMMGQFLLKEKEEQRRMLAAAAEEARRIADVPVPVQAHIPAAPNVAQALVQAAQEAAVPKVQGVSHREVWVWHVTDPGAIPVQYWSPDANKIEAAVQNGVRDIPGVVITKEVRTIVRS